MCICGRVGRLASNFSEKEARSFASDLNSHLAIIESLVNKSKSFAHTIHYDLRAKARRSKRVLSLESTETTPQGRIFKKFRDNPKAFWQYPAEDGTHAQLARRLACVAIYLLSKLDPKARIPATIAAFVPACATRKEYRYAGRRYVDMSRHLGGIGAVYVLPLEIPHSTYERYIANSDKEVVNHLRSLGLRDKSRHYNSFVQNVLLSQLRDSSLPSYLELSKDFEDVLPDSEYLFLLIHALGGSQIPELLLANISQPHWRWHDDGHMYNVAAQDFRLNAGLAKLLLDGDRRSQAMAQLSLTRNQLGDGTITWSLCPESSLAAASALSPQTTDTLVTRGWELVNFSCSSSSSGGTPLWQTESRKALWVLVDKLTDQKLVPPPARNHALEVLLFFAEGGPLDVRRVAVERAGILLQDSTPNYMHASVALYQSIVCRLDGDSAGSDSKIRTYLEQNLQSSTRRDHALAGKLHLSLIENMMQRHDPGLASVIYSWQPQQPTSPLEFDVNHRLLLATAKFFQSVGIFGVARESLENCLEQKLLPRKSRSLIVARLADICCELNEYERASTLVEAERDTIRQQGTRGRLLRRLLLASVEADIGQGWLRKAETSLEELTQIETKQDLDINDQLLRVRELMASARIPHYQGAYVEALRRWDIALLDIIQHSSFRNGNGFTAAVIYLSIAHGRLSIGDIGGGRLSWESAVKILRKEKCDYWIPVVATTWLSKIANDIHDRVGWPLSIMKPDGVLVDLTK